MNGHQSIVSSSTKIASSSSKSHVIPLDRQILVRAYLPWFECFFESISFVFKEKLKPAKVFHDAVEQIKTSEFQPSTTRQRPQITSIAFDPTGERCLTADEGDAFILWDMNKAK